MDLGGVQRTGRPPRPGFGSGSASLSCIGESDSGSLESILTVCIWEENGEKTRKGGSRSGNTRARASLSPQLFPRFSASI